ncbi:MAG: phenylalanine--tRNA ligase subunit alpha [Candidatus Aenigmatarchaeota archaeon]
MKNKSDLIKLLNQIFKEAKGSFNLVNDLTKLEEVKNKYLGRKSYLSNIPSLIKNFNLEEKKQVGRLYNKVKKELNEIYLKKKQFLFQRLSQRHKIIDLEFPGKEISFGKKHLISQTLEKVIDIFIQLGFSVIDFEEIVREEDNFEYLNIPKNHPARDLWDTLWLKNDRRFLFRTHTSVFQVPTIKKFKVPIKVITFGKVFRYEATDKTHDFEFYQIDGISINKDTNLGHLRYVVQKFFEEFFKKSILVRFRPGYFPFVEPGLEIDISCIFCNQKGCLICKNSGFIEVAGAGMIHNFVLKSAGIDYQKYQGYAFGFGFDRLVMLKHNINDIRILHSSDLRFIRQF